MRRRNMTTIDGLPPLREVIRRHRLSARKSLGQNFLLDLNLTARIARAAGDLTQTTVNEIGPGPGALPRACPAPAPTRGPPSERPRAPAHAPEGTPSRPPGGPASVRAAAMAPGRAARIV